MTIKSYVLLLEKEFIYLYLLFWVFIGLEILAALLIGYFIAAFETFLFPTMLGIGSALGVIGICIPIRDPIIQECRKRAFMIMCLQTLAKTQPENSPVTHTSITEKIYFKAREP